MPRTGNSSEHQETLPVATDSANWEGFATAKPAIMTTGMAAPIRTKAAQNLSHFAGSQEFAFDKLNGVAPDCRGIICRGSLLTA